MWLHDKIKKTDTVMENELLSGSKELMDVLGIHALLFGNDNEFIADKGFAMVIP